MSIPRPNAYERKARLYARSRWDYPQAAVDQIARICGISSGSVIADIGSGTGMLAQHFLPLAKLVYGVEPGGDMRLVMAELLGAHSNFRCVRGSAEATSLPDHSVDLITAGMAIHWFEPEDTVREFARILKPGGMLAILRYEPVEQELTQAIAALPRPAWTGPKPSHAPISRFIDEASAQQFTYTSVHREDEQRLLEACLATADAPSEADPEHSPFRDGFHRIFSRLATDGLITITQRTYLTIGHLARSA